MTTHVPHILQKSSQPVISSPNKFCFFYFFTFPTSTPIIFFFSFLNYQRLFFVNRKRNPFPHYPLHFQLLHINIFTEMLSKTFASSTLRLAAVRRSAPALQQLRYASTNQDDRHVCSTISFCRD